MSRPQTALSRPQTAYIEKKKNKNLSGNLESLKKLKTDIEKKKKPNYLKEQ